MSLFEKPRGKKYHTRTIEINTYEYDEQRLVVEGCLADHRLQEYHLATGEERPPGLLHQMIIHMLVNKTTLEIEDLHVEMNCPWIYVKGKGACWQRRRVQPSRGAFDINGLLNNSGIRRLQTAGITQLHIRYDQHA
jgi:hypothetical protein